ncbi:MAG: hypothetical protein M3Z16_11640 [Pseudomonadota bacterium]|nr:hypothetical protein [Pseudomonadota bacterium]
MVSKVRNLVVGLTLINVGLALAAGATAAPAARQPCVELAVAVPAGAHFQSLEGNDYRARWCAGQLQRIVGRIYGESYRDEETYRFVRGQLVSVRARHIRYSSTFGPVAGVAEKTFVFESGRLLRTQRTRKRGLGDDERPASAAEYLAAGTELATLARAAAAKCLRADGSRRRDEALRSECAAPT